MEHSFFLLVLFLLYMFFNRVLRMLFIFNAYIYIMMYILCIKLPLVQLIVSYPGSQPFIQIP